MKTRLLLTAVLACSALSLTAQIYTPGNTIQGSSGNNNVGIGIGTPTSKLAIRHTDDGAMLSVQSSHQDAIKIFEVSQEEMDGYLYLRSANGVTTTRLSGWLNTPSFIMTNVGIGTTTPTSKLAIQHTNDGSMLSVHTSYAGNSKIFEVSQEGMDGYLYIRSGSGIINARLSGYATVPTYFMTNVGIGTQSPDAKLAVKGTIHAEEVRVDLNVPGPDYVFNEDYELTDLSQLKQYLKANKHLPGIESANEMKENGINVGDLQMKLLQKVEELTLYTIQQNEEIKELREKIKALELKQ